MLLWCLISEPSGKLRISVCSCGENSLETVSDGHRLPFLSRLLTNLKFYQQVEKEKHLSGLTKVGCLPNNYETGENCFQFECFVGSIAIARKDFDLCTVEWTCVKKSGERDKSVNHFISFNW